MDPLQHNDEGVAWLSLPSSREQRRYLEAHPELLGAKAAAALDLAVTQMTLSSPEMKQVRRALLVLQDARSRGGGAAIREAAINVYGGLVLDVPSWIQEVEQQIAVMKQGGRPDQYEAGKRVECLRSTITRARADTSLSPETVASLQLELAVRLWQYSGLARDQILESARAQCVEALSVYTFSRYPFQYARIQGTLGTIYRDRMQGEQRDNLEASLEHYQRALHVYSPELFSVERAEIQCWRGDAYRQRILGEKRDNVEQAIACFSEALQVFTPDSEPYDYAETQHCLGIAYWTRIQGDRRANIEEALGCMDEALSIFTFESYPFEYGMVQNDMSLLYSYRVAGERRENLERAIACMNETLRVCTRNAFPHEHAQTQNNLGLAYWDRIAGEKRENIERALACYQQVLQVYDRVTFPIDYARTQNNLGLAYKDRIAGDRSENIERAIACYSEVASICTLETSPIRYAISQNNLGVAYRHRMAGDRKANLEQAIVHFQQSLLVRTAASFPYEHAQTVYHLANVYRERLSGERRENLEQSAGCLCESLEAFTPSAFPFEHRRSQLSLALTYVELEDWQSAHESYQAALEAEDLLVALGTGIHGRDAVLKEGHDASARDGMVLTRLGRIEDAAVVLEHGRARGLAEALQLNEADSSLIADGQRRLRYSSARKTFIETQALLHAPLPASLDEDGRRRSELERMAAYREAKNGFDAIVEEIRAAGDPADFLHATLSAETLLQAAEHCGCGHALVYLAATPWGGVAVSALAANPGLRTGARFAALELPALTSGVLDALLETPLDGGRSAGGFGSALQGGAFDQLMEWPGQTLWAKASGLRAACRAAGQRGTLEEAAEKLLAIPEIAPLGEEPIGSLSQEQKGLLAATLDHALLQRELERSLTLLSEVALEPLLTWLWGNSVTSLTLIPCGRLAAFPLGATLLPDGRTVGEMLPTSMAPSARSLLSRGVSPASHRQGLYALGNPLPTLQELRWGEAEASTLGYLANSLGMSSSVRVQWLATRDWLLQALHSGAVVEVSCHGAFDAADFLHSHLLLANRKTLTLASLLSYQADLRGLRLLILSACQTALLDLKGAHDEVRSLAAGMLQAGATAVLAALWAVDDRATYLLMVRFAQEWLPNMEQEPPAAALARAQHWLRTVTNAELQLWQALRAPPPHATVETLSADERKGQLVVRGRGTRFEAAQAQEIMRDRAEEALSTDCPFADPYYWAGFQITGW